MQRLMINGMVFLLIVPGVCLALRVEYFGRTALPPTHNIVDALVCLLDRGAEIQAAVERDMRRRMSVRTLRSAEIVRRYALQFRALSKNRVCQFLAAQRGVRELPALVMDQRTVIYGQRNIAVGLREYRAYRERDRVE